MISKSMIRPVLVAGFFVWASGLGAQVDPAKPVALPAGVLPLEQGDMSVNNSIGVQPLPAGSTDSRSLAIRVQQLEEEIRRLNGLVEEQSSLLMRLQDQSLERYVEMDRRLAAIGTTESVPTSETEALPADDGVDVATTPTTIETLGVEAQPEERDAYRSAYGLVRERRFDDAISAFSAFLSAFPFGQYAPNAHYWLGELYLVIEPADPESARQNFQLLLDQYPNDRKVPDALYKLGRVHALKGNMERAREYLARVVNEYGPQQHPAAQLAQDFLDSQE